ncbi:MAG: iron-containing alcohol dehydrogenase [Peptococcaceae bacterium]|nr:iron-containing alcohol dehydrogenase [Peptococcaceae bacterium]
MLLDYEFPTHVIMKKDALADNADRIAALGGHALVVIDAGMDDAHPAKQETLFCLEYKGLRRTLYLHTRKIAPTIANLEAGAALAREVGADFVIAVGCDATLEAGKAIALLAAQDIKEATLYAQDITPLPVVCIPTSPGSGTEATPEIHVAQQGLERLTLVRNPLAAPQLAILDPAYVQFMDDATVVNNYIKSLGRAVEAITSEAANSISDAIAIAALGTISDLAGTVLNADKGFTLEDREQFMLASHQAGLAIALSGANMLEALASPLTYASHLRLGQAYGLIIPPVVAMLMERAPLVSDVILQSLYFSRLESLEDFLWALIGEIEPIPAHRLEISANAASSNPLIKAGVLSLDFKDIASCYAHLVAEDEA